MLRKISIFSLSFLLFINSTFSAFAAVRSPVKATTTTKTQQSPVQKVRDKATPKNTNTPRQLPADQKTKPTDTKKTTTPEKKSLTAGILKNYEDHRPTGINVKLQADNTSGALILDYPLHTPPGRNGLQPDLKLTYNSQAHNEEDIFGYGWSINIPYIERLNKDGIDKMYSENYFTSSLSGELQGITINSFPYGSYGAKIEDGNFLKYEFKNTKSWEVTAKNGLKYKFGLDWQSRQDNPDDPSKIYKWLLDEVRDTNDNYIKYQYVKDAGQIYPYKIIYTGSGATDGPFSIEFIKIQKPTDQHSYRTGFKVTTNYQMTQIKENYNDSTNLRYNLGYFSGTGDNKYRFLLNQIARQGDDAVLGSKVLPADKFEYQKNSGGWSLNKKYSIPVDLYNAYLESSGVHVFDVNGDALPDFVFARTGDPTAVYINQGNDKGWKIDGNYWVPVQFTNTYGSDLGVRIADVNGDGLMDFIWSSYDTGRQVYLNKGDGTGWGWKDPNYLVPVDFVGKLNVDMGVRIADVNGDGLPDILRSNNNNKDVYLNKGDGTGWYDWPVASSFDIPVNFLESGSAIADVNADGLADILFARKNYYRATYINTGKTWQKNDTYYIPVDFAVEDGGDNGVRIDDANGDGLPDLLYARDDDMQNSKVYINGGNGISWYANPKYIIPKPFIYESGSSDNGVRLADANGDGIIDFLYRNDSEPTGNDIPSNNQVYINQDTNVPDLLRFFYNSKGGHTEISYRQSPRYVDNAGKILNPKLFASLPLVWQIYNDDGLKGFKELVGNYTYEGGEFFYKNPLDRKFAGFGRIKDSGPGFQKKSYFHQGNSTDTVKGEFQDHPSKIGRPYLFENYDSEGNNLYAKTFQRWENVEMGSNRDFVKLTQKVASDYDGKNSAKSSAEKYVYDDKNGNLLQQTMMGEVQVTAEGDIAADIGNDLYTTDYAYAQDTSAKLSFPATEIMKDQSGTIVKQTQIFYDNLPLFSVSKGNNTKQNLWIEGNKYSGTGKIYNSYGLVTQTTDPLGNPTTYKYDNLNLYPATVTNALSQSANYTYDYATGNVKQYVDTNGNKFETVYDIFHRPLEKKQPDNLNPANSVTVTSYLYNDNSFPSFIVQTDKSNSTSPGSKNYTYYDGLSRPIQTRQQLNDPNIFSVRDFQYNDIGLLYTETLPYLSSDGNKTTASSDNKLIIKYIYDPLKRPAMITNILGTTNYSYEPWKTTITDAENNSKDFFVDAYNNLVKVVEHNAGSNYVTEYQYSGLNRLAKITDALGNIRNFLYDGLSRRLSTEDMHAPSDKTFGTHTYNYDALNIISATDQNGQNIKYAYDKLNRLTSEDFTTESGIETAYVYDNCPNGISRLCAGTYNGVETKYSYDALGNTISESRVIAKDQYTTAYTYDWLGNITSLIYPDKTAVTYGYNSAGKIKNVKYQNSDIVKNIAYAATGAISEMENANGTIEKNNFDPAKLYRLSSKTTSLNSQNLQNVAYDYDKVGNVLKLSDSSDPITQKTANYQYDDLYRLKSATIDNTANNQNYSHSFSYDAIGDILSKSDEGNYQYFGNQGDSYATPNAVTAIGTNIFNYDKNGNLLKDGKNNYTWDYKNRLLKANSSASSTQYLYDHTGERVKKTSGSVTTLYPNKFYEIRGDATTKNIYVGADNVASITAGKVTTQPDTIPPQSDPKPPAPEPTPTPTPEPNSSLKDVVYEDAEDGKTLGWGVLNPLTSILNAYEDKKQGNVILLKNPFKGDYDGYKLVKDDNTNWANNTHKFFSFDLNSYNKHIQLSLSIETNKGPMSLQYNTIVSKSSVEGNIIYIKLDTSLLDGNWQTITRDLQADINSVTTGITLNQINYLQISWIAMWENGSDYIKLDNIRLQGSLTSNPEKKPVPPPQPIPPDNEIIYEDAEDGDTLGWKPWSATSTLQNLYGNSKNGKIISLDNTDYYLLQNEDGAPWNNTTHKFLGWDMNFSEPFFLKVVLSTDQGEKELVYYSSDTGYVNQLDQPQPIFFKLDDEIRDGKWHTLGRDPEADLGSLLPGIDVTKVEYIYFQGPGKIDNVKMLKVYNPPDETVAEPEPDPDPQPVDPEKEIVYEDAEDGDTNGWTISGTGAALKNVYEDEKQGNVMALSGLVAPIAELKNKDGTNWANSTHKIFSWDMNSTTNIQVKVAVETDKGAKYIVYATNDLTSENKPTGNYVYFLLDPKLKDGKWHTIEKDLQSDLTSIQPGTTINKVNAVQFWWPQKMDNIKLMKSLSIPLDPPPFQPKTVDLNTIIYHHTDHLSGSNIDTDETGKVVEMADYYPFGALRLDHTTTAYRNPYKFTGKELDTDTGLYYYSARYYYPQIGRFISQDPWEGDLKDPQTLNKYSYVMNNPLKYNDPSGKCYWDGCLAEISIGSMIVTALMGGYVAVSISNSPEIPTVQSEPYNIGENEKINGQGINDGAQNAMKSLSEGSGTVGPGGMEPQKDDQGENGGSETAKEKISPKNLLPTENPTAEGVRKMEQSMRNNGFYSSKPIRYYKIDGQKYIIEGHHRAQAAKNLGIDVYAKEVVGDGYFKAKWGTTAKDFIEKAKNIYKK